MNSSQQIASDAPRETTQRIYIVEDHPIARAGYTAMIAQTSGLEVCGEAGTASDAFTSVIRLKPDLLLLDIGLKASNGLDLAKSLLAVLPDLRVLVVSMQDERFYAERALRMGAKGYLMKDEALEELLRAIRTVLSGEIYLSPRLKALTLPAVVEEPSSQNFSMIGMLNGRELEIFELIGVGYATREIAVRLKLSAKTVDFYREKLKSKLRFGSSAEVSRYAIRWVATQGLIIN